MQRTNSVKKHTRSVKETVVIYLIGVSICVYLGFLCGAVWISGNDFNEFMNNFQSFVIDGHHYIVGVTSATWKFVLVYLIGWSMAFIIIFTKIEHPFAGEEYGRARWGDAKEFTRQFANHDEKNEVEVVTGDVRLTHSLRVNTANYWIAEGVYLSIHNEKTSNLNMLVVGPPGSGKSFRLARPLLSQLCGNFLATDPKGELYKQTGQYFEDNGYEVMVMNVESEDGMPMSIHFNPFRYIRNESDIMSIAGILMKATTPAEDNGNSDQFFEQSAEVLLTSIIYLIHYYYPKEEQNWETFVMLLNATCVYTKNDGSIDNRAGGILDIEMRAQKYWKEECGHDSDFPGFIEVEKFYHGAAETTSSIVASLDAHCRYMKLKCVIDLLSEDEIHIADSFGYSRPCKEAGTGKRILYIVTSEDKRYYDWIPSMVYSLFFDELYHLTAIDPALHETLPVHLTFLMDEFANVTLPDSFVEKLSTMRSRNMSAVIIVQNLIQLKRKFPKFDMDKDLIGNCSIIDILGAPDMDSCEYLSKHFGTQTIHKASESDAKDYKGQSSRSEDVMQKSLLSAEDIFAMKKDGECAIVVKGTEPLYQTKCQMEKTDFVKLLCRKKNPYDPRKQRIKRERRYKNNDPVMLSGKKAREEAKRLLDAGEEIRHITVEEALVYKEAIKMEVEPKEIVLSMKERQKLLENARRYEEKHSMMQKITLEEFHYNSDGSVCDQKEYERRCLVVRSLINNGFSNVLVRFLKPLISNGYSYYMIRELFNENSGTEEVRDFIEQVKLA